MSTQEAADEIRPTVPRRSSQRNSTSNSTSQRDSLYRASPQISPVQPAHPVVAESSKAPVPPPASEKPAVQQTAPTGQPPQAQPAQQVQTLFPGTAPADTVKTKRQELEEGDAHWKWKIGFRAISIIVSLIGIGCAAWITARYTNGDVIYSSYYVDFYFEDTWTLPWTLITFTLAFIWSSACVIVFFVRRANRPVHPGAQVGCDLILWLALLCTGGFAIVGTMSVGYWGSDGTLSSYSSYGDYEQASNGTWIWVDSSSSSYYSSSSRSCASGSSSFSSCAQQDAYVNALWAAKNQRYNVDLTATVCQFIAALMHFILFIWACFDTNRRRHTVVSKDAEKLAAEIVMNMVKNGAIIPPPGQAYFPPMAQQGAPMGSTPMTYPNQQYYPMQQFPPQQQHPGQWNAPIQHGKAPVPQTPVVPSSSNEKSEGMRYA